MKNSLHSLKTITTYLTRHDQLVYTDPDLHQRILLHLPGSRTMLFWDSVKTQILISALFGSWSSDVSYMTDVSSKLELDYIPLVTQKCFEMSVVNWSSTIVP